MPDEADPPRKNYGFKDREFKRDNVPTSDLTRNPTVQELAKMAGAAPSKAKGDLSTVGPAKADPNDVHAVLQRNREAEKKLGGDEIEVKKVSSHRKRDYWLVFLTAELVFGGVVTLGLKQQNPFFLVFGLTGMVIFGLAITWIMWQLMDRY